MEVEDFFSMLGLIGKAGSLGLSFGQNGACTGRECRQCGQGVPLVRKDLVRFGEISRTGGVIRKAFMLGAGLGTRLRPLTHFLPKPLVPLFHRPLMGWAMEACRVAGIEKFAINTHHLPDRWTDPRWGIGAIDWKAGCFAGSNGLSSQEGRWEGLPISLFHEPVLLETGGGIRNIAAWVDDDDVLVHNGDIYSTLDLPALMAAHEASDNVVTLALRSEGPAAHIAIEGNQVVDIREMLGKAPGTHLFSGVYVFSPELLELIPDQEKVSVIPAFLELAKSGRLGGVVLDEGSWFDLGNEASYLDAHRDLELGPLVHPEARIAAGAIVSGSAVGPGVRIGEGARVRDSVIWADARVAPGCVIESAVVMPEA